MPVVTFTLTATHSACVLLSGRHSMQQQLAPSLPSFLYFLPASPHGIQPLSYIMLWLLQVCSLH